MAIDPFSIVGWLAMKAIDKVTDEALSRALEMIVKTNQEQLAKLNAIEQKLSALLQGPFNTGINYLEQGALPHRTAPEQQEYLGRALGEFNRALGNEQGNLEREAWIRWHIGLCHELRHEDKDAHYHFDKCSQEAKEALAIMQSVYESGLQKHDKAKARTDNVTKNWAGVLMGCIVILAIIVAVFGITSMVMYTDFIIQYRIVVLGLGFLVVTLFRWLMGALNPKPQKPVISPIMESLIKSVDQVLAMPGLDPAQKVAV